MEQDTREHTHPEDVVYDRSSGWVVWHMNTHHGWAGEGAFVVADLYGQHAQLHGQETYLTGYGAPEPQTDYPA